MPPYRHSEKGWLTGDTLAPETGRVLIIPGDLAFVMAVNGALLELTLEHNWQQDGTVTPEEAADAMRIMYFDWIASMNIFAPQAANNFFAGPGSGAAAPPTFRAILTADITAALTTPPPIGSITPAAGAFTTVSGTLSDAGTNTVVDALTLAHLTSATPVVAFGVGQMFKGHSSNNTLREMGHIRAEWANQSDAARVSQMVISAWNIGVKTDVATFYPNRLVLNSSPLVQLRWMTGGTTNVQLYHDGSTFLFLNSVGNVQFRNAANGVVQWFTNNISRVVIAADGKVSVSNTNLSPAAQLHVHVEDTDVSAVLDELLIDHNTISANSPNPGFGSAIVNRLRSSTTNNRKASILETVWNVSTDAAAVPDLVLSAYHNAAGTATKREGLRIRGGAAGTLMSVFGAAPVAQQVMGAAAAGAAYTAAEQAMLQAVYNAVRNFGIGT